MYTTKAKVEAFLNTTLSDSQNGAINDWIAWVKDYIDRYTNSTFEASADTTKLYDTNGKSRIFIDPVTSITTLKVVDSSGNVVKTLTANTDYSIYPLNTTVKNEIRLLPTSTWPAFEITNGVQRLQVIGKHGEGVTVPPAIEWAATRMVASLLGNGGSEGKTIKSETLGEYSVTFADVDKTLTPDITNMLDMYRVPIV